MTSSTLLEMASHPVQRITATTGTAFEAFVDAFESAVPSLDIAHLGRLAGEGASWEQITEAVAAAAPNSFLVFATFDSATLLAPAGNATRAVTWLYGNHVIAERMFRNDPRAVLYAPLRLIAFDDADGQAVIALERPSDEFGSLAHPNVTAVGVELDRKLADLLDVLDVPAAATALRATARSAATAA